MSNHESKQIPAATNLRLHALLPGSGRLALYARLVAKWIEQINNIGDRLRWASAQGDAGGAERAALEQAARSIGVALSWAREDYAPALRMLANRPLEESEDAFGFGFVSGFLGVGERVFPRLTAGARRFLESGRALAESIKRIEQHG